jgi:hypothetical protein
MGARWASRQCAEHQTQRLLDESVARISQPGGAHVPRGAMDHRTHTESDLDAALASLVQADSFR